MAAPTSSTLLERFFVRLQSFLADDISRQIDDSLEDSLEDSYPEQVYYSHHNYL